MLPALERRARRARADAGRPRRRPAARRARSRDAALARRRRARRWTRPGFETAHIVGNSLGGYVALQLAARGRARSVVALAPAGGWAAGDDSYRETLAYFATMQRAAAGRRAARRRDRRHARGPARARPQFTTDQLRAHPGRAARPPDARRRRLRRRRGADRATREREGWSLDAERIDCPVRIVWGTDDQLLRWPSAPRRASASEWLPARRLGRARRRRPLPAARRAARDRAADPRLQLSLGPAAGRVSARLRDDPHVGRGASQPSG